MREEGERREEDDGRTDDDDTNLLKLLSIVLDTDVAASHSNGLLADERSDTFGLLRHHNDMEVADVEGSNNNVVVNEACVSSLQRS